MRKTCLLVFLACLIVCFAGVCAAEEAAWLLPDGFDSDLSLEDAASLFDREPDSTWGTMDEELFVPNGYEWYGVYIPALDMLCPEVWYFGSEAAHTLYYKWDLTAGPRIIEDVPVTEDMLLANPEIAVTRLLVNPWELVSRLTALFGEAETLEYPTGLAYGWRRGNMFISLDFAPHSAFDGYYEAMLRFMYMGN